jgi:hypothetical protein
MLDYQNREMIKLEQLNLSSSPPNLISFDDTAHTLLTNGSFSQNSSYSHQQQYQQHQLVQSNIISFDEQTVLRLLQQQQQQQQLLQQQQQQQHYRNMLKNSNNNNKSYQNHQQSSINYNNSPNSLVFAVSPPSSMQSTPHLLSPISPTQPNAYFSYQNNQYISSDNSSNNNSECSSYSYHSVSTTPLSNSLTNLLFNEPMNNDYTNFNRLISLSSTNLNSPQLPLHIQAQIMNKIVSEQYLLISKSLYRIILFL